MFVHDSVVWLAVVIAATIKTLWGILVVFWLASGEPFWHQVVIVLGGSVVTAVAVIVSAIITSHRLEKPVHEVKDEIVEHRALMEADEEQVEGGTKHNENSP